MAAAAAVYCNVNAANYPGSRPLTRLITTNAPDIFDHVLCRVSKFVPREFAGSPTGPSSEEEGKKGDANQGGDEEGGRGGDSYHLARLRRRLTQRGYRGRLDGHIEGARST